MKEKVGVWDAEGSEHTIHGSETELVEKHGRKHQLVNSEHK